MSNLKKDIEELVRSVVASIGYYAMHGKTDKEATNLAVIAVSKEIINLIESVIPEYRDNTDNLDAYSSYDDFVSVGYNQAIKDIKSKLIGKG